MFPTSYIDHGSHEDQIEEAGLSARHIAATVLPLGGKLKKPFNSNNTIYLPIRFVGKYKACREAFHPQRNFLFTN